MWLFLYNDSYGDDRSYDGGSDGKFVVKMVDWYGEYNVFDDLILKILVIYIEI